MVTVDLEIHRGAERRSLGARDLPTVPRIGERLEVLDGPDYKVRALTVTTVVYKARSVLVVLDGGG